MDTWRAEGKNYKLYPHFDALVPPAKLEALVRDPDAVAHHQFFPFLLYEDGYRPFRTLGKDAKVRKIRYASRQDASIFSFYRHKLSPAYGALLAHHKIGDCVIAYRRLVDASDGRGKCNIQFARDAFNAVTAMGDCVAVALDISKYFERIDHAKLYQVWCRLVGCSKLPPDHLNVFKRITRYAEVDRDTVYERLGIIGERVPGNPKTRGYLVSYSDMDKQLCDKHEFRKKIAGGDPTLPNIIVVNKAAYGIPQGAPLSDLLANAYLLEFDIEMDAYARENGGIYRRYSDDILFILPGNKTQGLAAAELVKSRIPEFGAMLSIKDKKSCIVEFFSAPTGIKYSAVTSAGKNGFEYLGFRFDGNSVFLRDTTLVGFDRRLRMASRGAAISHVKRYRNLSLQELVDGFNFEEFAKEIGRIEGYDSKETDIKDWTFWTYASRAAKAFGKAGAPIFRQIRGHKSRLKARFLEELELAYSRYA